MNKLSSATQGLVEPVKIAIASCVMTMSLGAAIAPLGALLQSDRVLAQSATTAPNQILRIDGSTSMQPTNQIRIEQLQQRSPDIVVQTSYNGADAALEAVLDGRADLAAIGRPLTAEERDRGLVVVPQKRQKIAIVVGATNRYIGGLTFEQFARIFRGEITDWSQVGGPPGRIQLIDRPDTNDTRLSLQNYEVFKQAPFVAAPNAKKLTEDRLTTMVGELGRNGISYANADGIANLNGVRIVPMHKTLPLDPRYPFSQALAYVYKGPTPTPAAAALLGEVAAAAPVAVPAPAEPVAAVPAPAPANDTDLTPWLWLLLLPLLGVLWWLLKRSPRSAPPLAAVRPIAPVPPVVPVAPLAPVVPAANDAPIKLYEERLVGDKTRQKVGDVAVNKRIETEAASASIAIATERIIIERMAPKQDRIVDNMGFGEGKKIRLETYADIPRFQKEAFVREEVKIVKQVDLETATAEATVRHEELDIDVQSANGTKGI